MNQELQITCISLTNNFIVVCNTDQLLFFNRKTNEKLSYEQKQILVYTFAFDEETSKIAVDSEDNSILILQIVNQKIQRIFQSSPAHFNQIRGLVFYEQGKKLITCSHDEMIFIWDLETFQVLHQINQLKGKIQHLTLFHNQKFFTTISSEGYSLFYNLHNRKVFYCTNRINERAQEICGIKQNLMKNEKVLVLIDNKIKMISLNKQKILRVLQFDGEYQEAQFCLNDRALLLINYIDIKLFDHQTGIILKTIPLQNQVHCYSLDKENDILVYGNFYGSNYNKLDLRI
ncbi:unnamed protein product [Paramecium sonneborni]|uniref:Anaphase-promoting complex subunit 4-like WD40 domain-containing protein n=1 Tax=Paramecium sonneborni TaxID=65129 RepID=A0A8S1KJ35_9CILI|nr:unnamed protein product [Paramecium sonneborni]